MKTVAPLKTAILLVLSLLVAHGCASVTETVSPPVDIALTFPGGRPTGRDGYAGSLVCGGCHRREYTRWRETSHHRSLETLREIDRQSDAPCLRCHTTGYGLRGGYGQGEGDLGAVGCEACHGPSRSHASDPESADTSEVLGGGSLPCSVNEICRLCHTPEWDPGFTPGVDFDKIRCSR